MKKSVFQFQAHVLFHEFNSDNIELYELKAGLIHLASAMFGSDPFLLSSMVDAVYESIAEYEKDPKANAYILSMDSSGSLRTQFDLQD